MNKSTQIQALVCSVNNYAFKLHDVILLYLAVLIFFVLHVLIYSILKT